MNDSKDKQLTWAILYKKHETVWNVLGLLFLAVLVVVGYIAYATIFGVSRQTSAFVSSLAAKVVAILIIGLLYSAYRSWMKN